MAELVASHRFTVADLELMPDDEWHTYEVIDGELFVSKAAHFEHEATRARCITELVIWNERTELGVVLTSPGLIFGIASGVIPDAVWVSHERLARLADAAGHLQGAPELVVEVLSAGAANERRDRDVKLKLYSVQGVEEYWLIDWQARTMQVYRRREARLHLVGTLTPTDTLTAPILPGFSLAVGRLFSAPH